MDDRPAIVFRNVTFELGPDLHVFSGLDLAVPNGQICVLWGASGIGNSFFARLALGLFRPSTGSIEVLGVGVSHLPVGELHRFRQQMGFVFRGARLIGNQTVERNIGLPLNYHRTLPPVEVHRRVEELLDLLALDPVRYLRPVEITAERRMLTAFGRSAVSAPGALVYDDPLAGFSPDVFPRLLDAMTLIRAWVARNRPDGRPPTMLITATDPAPYSGFAERVGLFRNGRVYFDAPGPVQLRVF